MENIKGNMVFDNQRVYICIFVLTSAMLMVTGEITQDSGYKSDESTEDGLKTLWDLYILPRLELDLKMKVSDWLHEHGDQDISIPDRLPSYEYDNDVDQTYPTGDETQSRLKRIGLAGLENIDLMVKTLHQHRLPMSVSNMNSNRLQMLMRTVGRRRK